MVILVDREAFSNAVEQMLIAVAKAKDGEGRTCSLRPTPFRVAMELREALQRSVPSSVTIEIEDWLEIIRPMRPPFPPDSALGIVLRAGGATEEDGA